MTKGKKILIGVAVVVIAFLVIAFNMGKDSVIYMDAKIVNSKSGSGDVIGKVSVIEGLDKDSITDEQLINWVQDHINKQNLDYGVITYKDDDTRGIFSEGSYIDKDCELIPLDDGTYQSKADAQTKTYTIKDGKLVEMK